MAVKRISSETLIELAVATLNAELAPHLPAERRYTVAMIVNALDIARRDIVADGESAGCSLLDELYPEGDGTMARLAEDIRAGGVNDVNQPELRKRLHAIVVAELKVRNPKFLARRGYKG